MTDPGSYSPSGVADNADLRTDLPKYRVYQHGKLVDEPTDILRYWRDDLVSFLLGCSFTFEDALLQAGLDVRHISECDERGQAKNVPMYVTNIPCRSAGRFAGPQVVSMRPYSPENAIKAANVTARFARAHGAPIHWGDPSKIGIRDLARPDLVIPSRLVPMRSRSSGHAALRLKQSSWLVNLTLSSRTLLGTCLCVTLLTGNWH